MLNALQWLRTFALIVSTHPYCARNPLCDVMLRHALSAHTVEEMWRYIALVGTLISMHGFNSLKCSVMPYFLLIDNFLYRLSTFCEKLKCPEVVRHTKALTMYKQFQGLITKIKQTIQNNCPRDPRVVCVVSPLKTYLLHNTCSSPISISLVNHLNTKCDMRL